MPQLLPCPLLKLLTQYLMSFVPHLHRLGLGLLVWGCLFMPAQANELSVAVAANFAAPMQKLAVMFEQSSGHKIKLAVGSTGRFYAQIKNGAPFEVLLAADDETPRKLAQEGLAISSTQMTYAVGRLALWSKQPALVDDKGEVLAKGQFDKLALADPKLAPYGLAAIETLTQLGHLERLRPKLVQAENIAQAYQFVSTHNAPLGLVALSQIYQDGKFTEGSAWVVPAHLHSPIRQDAIVLNKGKDNPATASLLVFLRSDQARALIKRYGYEF